MPYVQNPYTGVWTDSYYAGNGFDFKGPTITPPSFLDGVYNPGGVDFSTSPGFGVGLEGSTTPIDNIMKSKRTSTATPKYGPTVANAKKLGAGATATAGAGAGAGAAPKGKFFKQGGFFDKGGGLGGFFANATNPQFDWNSQQGLQGWGKNLGRAWNVGNMAIQGFNAASGLRDYTDSIDSAEDMASDIISASYNSPTLQYDLSPEQLRMLRELRAGGDLETADIGDVDLLGLLPDVGMGILQGLPGGVPGMVIGGLGGLLNSGIGDLNNAQARNNAELEALYQAVMDSSRQHGELKKQRAYNMYGLR